MPRRSSRVESDSDSDGASATGTAAAPAATQTEKGWAALTEDEQDALTGTVVRHLLMRHATKAPVKRADISRALAVSDVKARNSIVKEAIRSAGEVLENTFAAKMVEVVKQTKGGRSGATQPQTQTQKPTTATQRAADGTETQVSGAGQKAFILVSSAEKEERRVTEDSATRAFLAVIASIILLTPECRVEEGELETALKTAVGAALVESGGHKQLNGGNVSGLVRNDFVRQWYLECQKEDGHNYYYIGPRLRAELDDDSLIAFISAVYEINTDKQGGAMDTTTRDELQQRYASNFRFAILGGLLFLIRITGTKYLT